MKPIDIVLEGGGARGLAHNGAAAAVHAAGFAPRRVVGTSAGAISATLIAAGYDGAELRRISLERNEAGRSRMTEFISEPAGFPDEVLMDSSLGRLLQAVDVPFVPEWAERKLELSFMRALAKVPGFSNLFSFVEEGGLFSADGFVRWLSGHLEARQSGMSRWTFAQMFKENGVDLSVVISDTTRMTDRVLNHRTAPDCPVLWGVRMSMSIPFFWPEVIWDKSWGRYLGEDITGHKIVDGGVVSNFDLRVLLSDDASVTAVMGPKPAEPAQILGLVLDGTKEVPHAPPPPEGLASFLASHISSKVLERVERVADTALEGNDRFLEDSHLSLVCALPTKGYGTVEFNQSPARIEALVEGGREAAAAHLAARLG